MSWRLADLVLLASGRRSRLVGQVEDNAKDSLLYDWSIEDPRLCSASRFVRLVPYLSAKGVSKTAYPP